MSISDDADDEGADEGISFCSLSCRGDFGAACAGILNELLLGLNEVNLGGVLGLAGILVFLLPFSVELGELASV